MAKIATSVASLIFNKKPGVGCKIFLDFIKKRDPAPVFIIPLFSALFQGRGANLRTRIAKSIAKKLKGSMATFIETNMGIIRKPSAPKGISLS